DMSNMFAGASSFNQDLGNWKTGSVTNMAGMFKGATSFGKGKDWGAMLDEGLAANIDRSSHGSRKYIGSWDTSSVQDMSGMFEGAASFDAPLTAWDFAEVVSTQAMFRGAEAFSGVIILVAPKLVDSSGMFEGAAAFDQPVAAWDTPRVRTTKNMFKGAEKFNQPVKEGANKWTLPSTVEDVSGMFEGATEFKKDLSGWDLPKEAKRENMFAGSQVSKRPQVDSDTVQPLSQPSKPEAGEVKTTSMKITWTKVTDATGYRLYYAAKTGFSLGAADTGIKEVKSSSAAKVSASVSGLQPNTNYYFKVVAVGDPTTHWDSPASAELKENTVFSGPSGLAVIKVGHDAVTLQWNRVIGASGYQVKTILRDNQGQTATIPAGSEATVEYKVSSLSTARTYTFEVRAISQRTRFHSLPATISATTRKKLTTPTFQSEDNSSFPTTASSITITITHTGDVKLYSEVTHFMVYYKKQDHANSFELDAADVQSKKIAKVIQNNEIHLKVEGLSANTWYGFRLVALAPAGSNKLSSDPSKVVAKNTAAS
ncbi:MAG: BspA family leucine-rich repeat surface protein, partial [Spirochaetota bacterium]